MPIAEQQSVAGELVGEGVQRGLGAYAGSAVAVRDRAEQRVVAPVEFVEVGLIAAVPDQAVGQVLKRLAQAVELADVALVELGHEVADEGAVD